MLLSERHFTRLVPRVIENLQLTVVAQGTAAGCGHGSWEGQASQKAGTRRCRLPPRGLLSPRLSHRRARRGVRGRCGAGRQWLRDGHSHPGGRPPRPLHGCLTVPTPPSRPLRVSSDGLPVPACPPRCLLQDATCSGRNVCVLPSVCVAIPPRSVVALAGRVSGGRLGHEGRVPTCESQGLACSPLLFAT